jgi:hypothetical protein
MSTKRNDSVLRLRFVCRFVHELVIRYSLSVTRNMRKTSLVLVWQGHVSGRTNKLFQIEISNYILERLHKGDIQKYCQCITQRQFGGFANAESLPRTHVLKSTFENSLSKPNTPASDVSTMTLEVFVEMLVTIVSEAEGVEQLLGELSMLGYGTYNAHKNCNRSVELFTWVSLPDVVSSEKSKTKSGLVKTVSENNDSKKTRASRHDPSLRILKEAHIFVAHCPETGLAATVTKAKDQGVPEWNPLSAQMAVGMVKAELVNRSMAAKEAGKFL